MSAGELGISPSTLVSRLSTLFWQNHGQQNHFFWGSACALRGYGVTLGASSSHAPFFSRAAAFEGSMTVSVVQAETVVWKERIL